MDPVADFADFVVQELGIADSPLASTRTAHLRDGQILDRLAARSLDLLALPAALATNMRLLEGEVEVPKQRWSRSRVGDGQVLHTELVNQEVDRAILQGGMVVIDSVDELDLTLMRLRESLEYRLSARAWINLYMTAAASSNFGLHYDTFDTLVIQLLGRKLWMVGDHSQPLGAVIDPTEDHDLREVELVPGRVLAMPERALHNAIGLGVFTMHLTIGFDRSAAIPRLMAEVDALLGQGRVPLAGPELELAKSRCTERRRGTSLPYIEGGDPGEQTKMRWSARLRPVVRPQGDGSIEVTSGRHEFTFSDIHAAVARVLVCGDEYTVKEVAEAAGVTVEESARVVRELATLDLLTCRYSDF